MGAGSSLFDGLNNANLPSNIGNIAGSVANAVKGLGQAQQPSSSQTVQDSRYGYNQFPLTPSSGGTNYNTALQVQTGDSDYTKAAKAAAQGNLATAQAAATANRVNQINPYGSIQYYQSGTDASGNPVWSSASSLAPEQQQLLNLQNQQSIASGNIASSLLGNSAATLAQPLSTAGLPQLQGNIQAQQLNQIGQGPAMQMLGAAAQQQGIGNAPNLQNQVQGTGMEGWDRATALINQRLQPQIAQSQERLQAQLANQGIAPGTEAYKRAMTQQGQQTNDLLTQAQLAGSQVQNTMFGQNLAAGQFGNQALTQQNQNQLANLGFSNQAQQQNYANQQAMLQQQNNAAQQQYQNQLASQQANNAALQQSYQNQLASANLANQARSQGLTEQQLMQNQPLNIINALRSGSQVQNPSFIGAPQQATTAGPDTLAAYQAQQQADIARQNQQAAQSSNLTSGLFGLGSSVLGGLSNTAGGLVSGVGNAVSSIGSGISNAVSGLGKMFSDIRMKENIVSVGSMANGLGIYEYGYKPEFKDIAGHGRFIGVMAQEVEKVIPEAVSVADNGYMMVDYGKLQ